MFDFTTAGEWDSAPYVKCLRALHYSVDYIALSFRIMDSIVELCNHVKVTDEVKLAETS